MYSLSIKLVLYINNRLFFNTNLTMILDISLFDYLKKNPFINN